MLQLQKLCSTVAGCALAMIAGAALAEELKSAAPQPTFGSRTENRDGSVALTIGRRLPTEWESKIGTDVSLASPGGVSRSENLQRGAPNDRSTGAIWGSITMPGPAPDLRDKTAIEARIDGGREQGKLGATLSRSVPLGQDLSVTLQNTYSVRQSFADHGPPTATLPLLSNPLPSALEASRASSPTWSADQSVRFDIDRSGTALSAGGGISGSDERWHNKLSAEQPLYGPLKVTTSVDDPGTAASKKSLTARFKRTW